MRTNCQAFWQTQHIITNSTNVQKIQFNWNLKTIKVLPWAIGLPLTKTTTNARTKPNFKFSIFTAIRLKYYRKQKHILKLKTFSNALKVGDYKTWFISFYFRTRIENHQSTKKKMKNNFVLHIQFSCVHLI